MESDITVSLVQFAPTWMDVEANLALLSERITPLAGNTDLIVLPEMFATGFSMEPEKVAHTADRVTEWLTQETRRLQTVITGSTMVELDGNYFNRLFWIAPVGTTEVYDKRHLFRMGGEHEHYAAGAQHLVTQIGEWRVRPLICYDLRFPIWSRNRNDYDLLIYVANWPAARRNHWITLLKARAIENQCYTIGVNRIGTDGKGVSHSGDSLIISPKGEIMADLEDKDAIVTQSLSLDELKTWRSRFPAWMDADAFEIKL